MPKKKIKKSSRERTRSNKGSLVAIRKFNASAPDHGPLANNNVHIFVDDQNLFYGIVNHLCGPNYRIDFGNLLRVAALSSSSGGARPIGSAYIAGVIPDDDSFWEAAKSKGFTVHRGYLNSGGRSKQDDAYLITSIMETLYEEEGPSTIVLVAGDADYAPPLLKCLDKGWRVELAFTDMGGGISMRLSGLVHEFREFSPADIEKTW